MIVEPHSTPTPPPSIPMTRPLLWRMWRALGRAQRGLASYVLENDPRVLVAWTPYLMLAFVLYVRHLETNYIFDEQEALLANPYVNATQGLKFWDAIHRDFWGLPPDASIGSYRPLPNLLWRSVWSLHEYLPKAIAHVPEHPVLHHIYNVGLHSLNGALLAAFAFAVTRRRSVGWLAGLAFVVSAILTEAVSGIVGLADVLGGLGALIALNALRLPGWGMPFAVFFGVLLGLFSKESALVCVPLIPAAALVTAPMLHEARPARVARALLALAGALGAFVLYVELRKQWFPSPLPEALQKELPAHASALKRHFRDFLIWFHQAPLPKDPLNNPLVDAKDIKFRVAGAMRVYWRGLTQVLFPLRLSGDYSYPQEPVPARLYEWENVAGAVMTLLPPLVALGLWIAAMWRERGDRRALAKDGSAVPALTIGRVRLWRPSLLRVAVALIAAGAAGIAVEIAMIRKGDAGGVRTWPYSAAVLCAGLGALIESWRTLKTPVVARGKWPWLYCNASLVALGFVWIVVSYFPHSNIPVVLPTVRAERFWYFPVIGSSLALGVLFGWIVERWPQRLFFRQLSLPTALLTAFFGFQCARAYLHSMDYHDDLAFWRATKNAVPRSAKAHLNYSVMIGARGNIPGHMEARLAESHIARKLAPQWAMAHIYTGDTLCRMQRAEEAWPHYAEGFDLGPNDKSLISLALQCMYDEDILLEHGDEMREIADRHPGNTWLAFLVNDTLAHHDKNKGVDPQYRPRGYNEGAKDE